MRGGEGVKTCEAETGVEGGYGVGMDIRVKVCGHRAMPLLGRCPCCAHVEPRRIKMVPR